MLQVCEHEMFCDCGCVELAVYKTVIDELINFPVFVQTKIKSSLLEEATWCCFLLSGYTRDGVGGEFCF